MSNLGFHNWLHYCKGAVIAIEPGGETACGWEDDTDDPDEPMISAKRWWELWHEYEAWRLEGE